MSFKKNKYQVIRSAISKEVADIAYKYLKISAEADYWMLKNGVTHKGNKLVVFYKWFRFFNNFLNNYNFFIFL